MALALRPPDSKHGPLAERTRRKLTATIKDEAGAVIPGTSLLTCVYTLYSEHTLNIINGRLAVDCKPNVDANGVLTLVLTPADMQIENDSLLDERHRLLIEWTYDTDGRGAHEAQIIVSNAVKVP